MPGITLVKSSLDTLSSREPTRSGIESHLSTSHQRPWHSLHVISRLSSRELKARHTTHQVHSRHTLQPQTSKVRHHRVTSRLLIRGPATASATKLSPSPHGGDQSSSSHAPSLRLYPEARYSSSLTTTIFRGGSIGICMEWCKMAWQVDSVWWKDRVNWLLVHVCSGGRRLGIMSWMGQ